MDPTETARRVLAGHPSLPAAEDLARALLDAQRRVAAFEAAAQHARNVGDLHPTIEDVLDGGDTALSVYVAVEVTSDRAIDREKIATLERALLESQAALAAAQEERTTLVNDLIDYENVRQHLAAADECQKRHDTLDRVETERDALRADLARVTAERDEARDRLSEVVPVLNRVIEERDAALATAERFAKYVDAVAPLAAPAPPPSDAKENT